VGTAASVAVPVATAATPGCRQRRRWWGNGTAGATGAPESIRQPTAPTATGGGNGTDNGGAFQGDFVPTGSMLAKTGGSGASGGKGTGRGSGGSGGNGSSTAPGGADRWPAASAETAVRVGAGRQGRDGGNAGVEVPRTEVDSAALAAMGGLVAPVPTVARRKRWQRNGKPTSASVAVTAELGRGGDGAPVLLAPLEGPVEPVVTVVTAEFLVGNGGVAVTGRPVETAAPARVAATAATAGTAAMG